MKVPLVSVGRSPVAPTTLIQLLHLEPLPLRGRAPLVGTTLETPERAALSPSAAPHRRRGPERDRAPNKKSVPPSRPKQSPCASVRLSVRPDYRFFFFFRGQNPARFCLWKSVSLP